MRWRIPDPRPPAPGRPYRVIGGPDASPDISTPTWWFWIRGQPKVKPRRAPKVGEHSDEVLRAAGYSDAEIRGLRAGGVIG